MINYTLLKISKRVAIMLLIAVFSIAGIISCRGAQDISGSVDDGGSTEIPDGTPVDPEPTPDPEPDPNPEPEPTPTFPEDTYYKIYAPWVKWDESQAPNGWRTNVSYQDTNTLSQIWKQQIEGGKRNDGNRWMIIDANNNSQGDPRTQSYYYFDKDFNIVYYRQGKGSLTVRKFLSGIIVKYKGGRNNGTYAIGGVYETLLTKNEITDNNFDQLNIFMGHEDIRADKGGLEILTMNTGMGDDLYQNEFGVDFYYNKSVMGEDQLGQYTSKNPDELNNFLGARNLSFNLAYMNFRFFFGKPYDWHLTDHLSQQGWH